MIATAGENIVDLIPASGGRLMPVPGGSAFNIAVAIGRLGAAAGYALPLSDGPLGDAQAAILSENSVAYLPAKRVSRNAGLALVSVDGGQPTYSFYRAQAADTDLEDGDLPQLSDQIALLQLGGCLSLGHPVCGPRLAAWAIERPAGMPLTIDPNIRPVLIADRAEFMQRMEQIIASGCLVMRLSDEDAEYMYPGCSAEQVCERLLEQNVALAVLTRGAAGSRLQTADACCEIEAAQIEVADTVGAGDTFMAALLVKLGETCGYSRQAVAGLTADQLRMLGRYAASAAAVTCSRSGCQPPTAHEVEQLLDA